MKRYDVVITENAQQDLTKCTNEVATLLNKIVEMKNKINDDSQKVTIGECMKIIDEMRVTKEGLDNTLSSENVTNAIQAGIKNGLGFMPVFFIDLLMAIAIDLTLCSYLSPLTILVLPAFLPRNVTFV